MALALTAAAVIVVVLAAVERWMYEEGTVDCGGWWMDVWMREVASELIIHGCDMC